MASLYSKMWNSRDSQWFKFYQAHGKGSEVGELASPATLGTNIGVICFFYRKFAYFW